MQRITTTNILGFSHNSDVRKEWMKAIKNYIPQPNETIALFHQQHGYLGGAGQDMQPVTVRDQLGETEYWTFESVGDLFALRSVYSGLYMGLHLGLNQQPKLCKHRQRGELYYYSIQQNGLVTINNMRGYHLSFKDGILKWGIKNTANEFWRFITPYNQSYYLNHRMRVYGLAMPPSQTLLAIAHCKGGYLGGNSKCGDNVIVSPVLGPSEKFIFQKRNDTFALKQQLTGNYIGGISELGKQLNFVQKWLNCETFTLDDQGNGMFSIRNQNQLVLTRQDITVYWSNELSQNAMWKFQNCSASTISPLPAVSRVTEPLDGEVYYILNLKGEKISGGDQHDDPVVLREDLNDDARWIFQQEGNTFFLRQASTGLFLGFTQQLGQQVRLAPKALDHERLRLEPKDQGVFLIKNMQGLILSCKGGSAVWGNIDSEEFFWTFEMSSSDLNLHNMAGGVFGLRSSKGGYIGGVRSGRLVIVERLSSWEKFQVELYGDKFALKQVASGLYVGWGSRNGERLSLVSHCQGAEQFQLFPMSRNLFAICNCNGFFITKKGENELILSTEKERWEFCRVDPEKSNPILASNLTMRVIEGIFGSQPPSYIKQIGSPLLKNKLNASTLPSNLPLSSQSQPRQPQ